MIARDFAQPPTLEWPAMSRLKTIAISTGGGDCPGLNAVIRAVTLALINECNARVTGIERGFLGLLTRQTRPLSPHAVEGLLAQGGTVLGTHNRCDPFHYFGAGGADCSGQAMDYVRELGLDALVAIGGDGTMSIAHRFTSLGLPMVGVPKTIDNDLYHTDRTFGFDSAVAVVAEALDRLETTARSHGRVMIAETMGRYSGWIALEGGVAGGADVILLPELDVEKRMPVKVTRHYFDLATKSKPMQRLVKASPDETMDLAGSEDPGHQMDYSPVEGLLHKYEMGLLYTVSTCSAHCRFCYREELIARKEIKSQTEAFAKASRTARREIAELKRRLQVLVRVSHCGVCHSDLHLWEGGYDLGGGKRMSLKVKRISPVSVISKV